MKTRNYYLLILLFVVNQLSASNIDYLSNPDQQKKIEYNFLKKSRKSNDNGIKGKFLAGATAGFNIWGDIMIVKYRNQTTIEEISFTTTPLYNFSVDYGIQNKLSIGVAAGYQKASIHLKERVYYAPYYYNTYKRTDKWERYHFAIRADYHIVANNNSSLYAGIKFGYNDYRVVEVQSTIYNAESLKPTLLSMQVHMGYSYYFGEVVGVNLETGIGLGGPYFGAIGLAVKL